MFEKKYKFGGVTLVYTETKAGDEKSVGLYMLPEGRTLSEEFLPDPMIQVAFTHDKSLNDYSRGISMKNREGCVLHVEEQTQDANGVTTRLSDGKGNFFTHLLNYDPETGVFEIRVSYENRTGKTRTLEYLASGAVGIVPLDGAGKLTLHRMTSAWSRECRLKSDAFYELGLECSWANYGLKSEKWGSVGSMPNRGYYPFAAIGDTDGSLYAMTLEAPYSWQMEVSLERNGVLLSGGLADYETGHWRKDIKDGESFSTHKCYFVYKRQGGVNAACNALVHAADKRLEVPKSEESMPVLYNEYCATWGVPSAERIRGLLNALKGLPVEAFVIDAGWFKPEDIEWGLTGGDWEVSKVLFPEGMKVVAEEIKAHGMLPGIWFEWEVAARDSKLFKNEELLLKRDSTPITCKNRRFLDLRKKETQDYIEEKLVRFLQDNGYSYLKIDYNDSYGIGCDGAESLGEGGRQVAEESVKWLDKLKEEVPGIVIENCASGGSRIEPYRMSKVSMCSFSDAHECKEIPLVAANISRVIPARQSQIWASLRQDDSVSRIVYSLCAAMMGRICLSGDIDRLNEGQLALVKEGLDFYKSVKDIVRYGDIKRIDCNITSFRDPLGRQIYIKEYEDKLLVIVHFLEDESTVEIPVAGFALTSAYTDLKYRIKKGVLSVSGKKYSAGAFYLQRQIESKKK